LLSLLLFAFVCIITVDARAAVGDDSGSWIGTWGVAPQPATAGAPIIYEHRTLRLIVHTSAGGTRLRVRFSNVYGDVSVTMGEVHVARRTEGSKIDLASDHRLAFKGSVSGTIPAHATLESDPIDLAVSPLSDLAVSVFLPNKTAVETFHILAQQTSYVAALSGNWTDISSFPSTKTIGFWPFLSGVDVVAKPRGATVVAFGSSTTDGDGSTKDSNHRWPDVLAARLQKGTQSQWALGVLNQGIIGNRLLNDSPAEGPFGRALGAAGIRRFNRDVLGQPGVKYVFIALGVNDIVFPGSFTPEAEMLNATDIIGGYRQLIAAARRRHIRIIGTTIPAFENAKFDRPPLNFYTPAKEAVRREVNEWILKRGEFDAAVDFDAVIRDPAHPSRILPEYDSGDHLHMNDAGYIATGNAVPLSLFEVARRFSRETAQR
jgi:lysophospholipase L1-like esterase